MKLRTIEQSHAFLLRTDPDCALTKTALRRLVTTGQIPSVKVGQKYLLDVDRLAELLFAKPPEETVRGIRKQEVRTW